MVARKTATAPMPKPGLHYPLKGSLVLYLTRQHGALAAITYSHPSRYITTRTLEVHTQRRESGEGSGNAEPACRGREQLKIPVA